MEINQNLIKSVSEIVKLINNQQFNIAEEELHKVIRIKKENYYPYYLLGNIYALQKKFSDALEQFKLSFKLNPNDKTLCYNLAVVYGELNEIKNSQNMFEKSLEIDPNYINANLGLAKNFEEQKKFDKAKFFFEQTIKLDKDFKLANQMYGKFLIKIGEISKGHYYNYKFSGVIRFNQEELKLYHEEN